ncbi:nucleoside triphosphate pyrophosphohydrolase [Methanogenium cariaci]|uniref:nucleoside triphosphate pyrophosphohydrolase n=1 Tax=Methanogenium cariaci TaxID=2197 RepID=UPI0007836273|nr:nucleoside triphosphate pyrophosphohydrolase [Methanogenium cariaci]
MIQKQRYDKAVRDRIPAIIRSQGTGCEVETCDDPTFLRYLEYKLIEELKEYLESKEPEELADLIEVCYRVAELRGGVSPDELEHLRKKKALERVGLPGIWC